MKIEFEYTYEEIHKIFGKINDQIEEFRKSYGKKPMFIILSNNLALAFREVYGLTNKFEAINLNDEYLEINRLFGFACFVSPTLSGLDFEIR